MNAIRTRILQIRNFLAYWKELGFSAAVKLSRRTMSTTESMGLRIRGIRFPVYCRANTIDFPILRQVMGRHESDVLGSSDAPLLIIDGGANVGYASVLFANRFPGCKIIAVEPEKSNFEQLLKNCEPYSNIVPVQGGVWHCSTKLQLVDKGRADSFQVRDNVDGSVQAYTIPQLMKMADAVQIDLLKLDIEGAEIEVLSHDADCWLDKTRVLLVELHERMRPGCEKALDDVLTGRKCTREKRGEYDKVVFQV
jgi:FkbM family methyltransferase